MSNIFLKFPEVDQRSQQAWAIKQQWPFSIVTSTDTE